MQIVPLKCMSYRYKKGRSVAFKIRQNPFSAGAVPRTPLGELTTLPQTPLSAGDLTPLGTDPPSALAMRPPEFQPDLRLCVVADTAVWMLQGSGIHGENYADAQHPSKWASNPPKRLDIDSDVRV